MFVVQPFSPQLFSFLWLIGLTSRIKKTFFGLIRKIPFVGGAVSISGDFVPSFPSQSALTLLSEALVSHPWITAAWGWVRPLAHFASCTGDNSWLLQAIMSPRDVSLSGFMKNVQKEFTAALYECFYCNQRQLMPINERLNAQTPCLWQIQGQLNKALDDMSASLCNLKEGMSYTKQLPSKGLTQSQVLDKIREYETLSKSIVFLHLTASFTRIMPRLWSYRWETCVNKMF